MSERNKWRLHRALGLKEWYHKEEVNNVIHDIIMEEVPGSVPFEEIKKEQKYVTNHDYKSGRNYRSYLF